MMLKRMMIAIALLIALPSCGPLPRRSARSGGGGQVASSARCQGDFGASAAANQFESFMQATYELNRAAESAQNTMLDACRRMGSDMGIPAPQLTGDGPEGTRAVCTVVAQRVRDEMQAVRAASATTVELRTQPARCEAHFDAYAECAARCDVNVQPGQLELRCEGGGDPRRLSGRVLGELRGERRGQLRRHLRGRVRWDLLRHRRRRELRRSLRRYLPR